MASDPIRQRVLVTAPVAAVYAVFLDPARLGELAGEVVELEPREGGAFRVGENVSGRFVALVENQLIVQAWRRSDWPPEEYSIASFRFQDLSDRTQLIFTHSGVPGHCVRDVRQSWYRLWQDLKKMFPSAASPATPEREPVTSDA